LGCKKDEGLNLKIGFGAALYTICDWKVRFSNCPENAEGYHWDFGDGQTLDEFESKHVYSGSNQNNVSSIAFSGNKSDTIRKRIYDG
jgi:hypothetical protein